MIEATSLKNGTTFIQSGKPYKVVKYAFQKLGRGGATVRITARNLLNANLEEKTFNSSARVDGIDTLKRVLTFLYIEGKIAVFMEPKNFEQFEIPLSLIEDEVRFISEGETVTVLFWRGGGDDGQDLPLSLEIPPKVTMKISQTDPGIKGNSAANMYKSAVLENGMEIRVPLFIKAGDKVRVDTGSGEYVERAS
jgi:elongation factor P